MINNTAQFAAQNPGHTKTGLFVLLKELQERLTANKIDSTGLKRFHGRSIRFACQRCIDS